MFNSSDIFLLFSLVFPYGGCGFFSFGCSGDLTSDGESDLDITAEISLQDLRTTLMKGSAENATSTPRHVLAVSALRSIRSLVHTSHMWSVCSWAFATWVPVLTIAHTSYGCQVDVTVNNVVQVRQGGVWKELYASQPQLPRLVSTVKLWARRYELYGRSFERLGGFGFTQMATFYMQVLGPGAPKQSLAQLVLSHNQTIQQEKYHIHHRQNPKKP